MNVVIIEDSRLARVELVELLKPHGDVVVAGEAENADVGIQQIQQLQPDLIFLDIHMPGKNGFEMLELLMVIPLVIFTTAYDQYAIKSFEYNAMDYLLKPVNPDRLSSALEKASFISFLLKPKARY